MELTARIHSEDGTYWADVVELPGVFATGDTLDELLESLQEGISLYLDEDGEITHAEPIEHVAGAVVEEIKIAVPA